MKPRVVSSLGHVGYYLVGYYNKPICQIFLVRSLQQKQAVA